MVTYMGTHEQWEYTYTGILKRCMDHEHTSRENGSIREVKKDGASEKGSLLPPTFISSSVEYLVSLFN